MLSNIRDYFAKRLLRQLITLATEELYSEQFKFDAIAKRLSRGKQGVSSLRAYVAIQTATQLMEPLGDADVALAFSALRASQQLADSPDFAAILDVHKELAEIHWLQKQKDILRGKLACKENEYSYAGTKYWHEFTKKGPTSSQERANFEPICKQISDLDREIEECELKAMKETNHPSYVDAKEEYESRALRDELDASDEHTDKQEMHEIDIMLHSKLESLLQNDIDTRHTVSPEPGSEEVGEAQRNQDIALAFLELMTADTFLIGDCSMLPYPKKTILYSIKAVMEDYEIKRDTATDHMQRTAFAEMFETFCYYFTHLARDWQEIDPEDKDAIAELRGCDSFPDWALPLKMKYINEDRASKEASEAAFQVMIDKIDSEKRHRNAVIA